VYCGKLCGVSSEEADRFPVPPFPHPDSDILRVVVEHAMAEYESGEVDVKGAIVHAAVHAWFEGHLEGEDSCPGCEHRGEVGRGIFRENYTRDAMRDLRQRLERLEELGLRDDEEDDF
jgi:hypothetical protein